MNLGVQCYAHVPLMMFVMTPYKTLSLANVGSCQWVWVYVIIYIIMYHLMVKSMRFDGHPNYRCDYDYKTKHMSAKHAI